MDESAITGESASVIKAPGDSVTGGTVLLSDLLVVEVTTDPGQTFLDRMIALVEGAARQKHPMKLLSRRCWGCSPSYLSWWW